MHANKTLTLILHIPMISVEKKLNLLQFIPSPLSQSLGVSTTKTPKVNKDLIAVGKNYQYKIMAKLNWQPAPNGPKLLMQRT